MANPRQIERVVRGAKFDLEIIYNVEDPGQIGEDFKNLQTAFDLLAQRLPGWSAGRAAAGASIWLAWETRIVTGDKAIDVPERR